MSESELSAARAFEQAGFDGRFDVFVRIVRSRYVGESRRCGRRFDVQSQAFDENDGEVLTRDLAGRIKQPIAVSVQNPGVDELVDRVFGVRIGDIAEFRRGVSRVKRAAEQRRCKQGGEQCLFDHLLAPSHDVWPSKKRLFLLPSKQFIGRPYSEFDRLII
nr:hypothetical protein [Saccharibacillus sp. O23]